MPQIESNLYTRMQEAGIQRVVCSYYGSGDNCDGVYINQVVPDVAPPDALREEIETFAGNAVYTHFAGYENNEGGGGEVTIDAENQTATLHHYYNVVDTIYEPEVELDVPSTDSCEE